MTRTLSDDQRALLAGPNFAHLATVCADGRPQVTPVWIDVDGDVILVNTAEGRVKVRNVRRDPRVAISIYDAANPYAWFAVQGRVVDITAEGANDLIDKLSHRYMGMEYPDKVNRLTLRIEPDSVTGSVS